MTNMPKSYKIVAIMLLLILVVSYTFAQDAFIYLRPYRTDIGATYADSITVVIGRPPNVTGLVKYHIWTKTAGGGEYSLLTSTYDDSLAFAAATPANYYVKVQTETVSYLGGRKTVVLQDFEEAPERNIDINSYLNYFFNTSTGYLRASAIDADSITIGGGSIADTLKYYSRIDTLGNMAVEDLVESSKLGTTIVSGGYLQTIFIDADYIRAGLIRAGIVSADSINAGTLTGRTVQTSATGQRVVINGSTNAIEFYTEDGVGVGSILASSAVGDTAVAINLGAGTGGGSINITGGGGNSASLVARGWDGLTPPRGEFSIVSEAITPKTGQAVFLIQNKSAGNSYLVFENGSGTDKFVVDVNGAITTVGDVDGVDVSAHAANVTTIHLPSQTGATGKYLKSDGSVATWETVSGSAMTALAILDSIKTVDGAASGLDADLLDGNSSAAFLTRATFPDSANAFWARTSVDSTKIASGAIADSDIAKLTASKLLGQVSTTNLPTIPLNKGGTNATSMTANQLVRVNSDANALEASGYTPASFAESAKGVTNGDSHDHNGGDGAQIAYSSLSGKPSLGTIAAYDTGDFLAASMAGDFVAKSTGTDTSFTFVSNVSVVEDPPGTYQIFVYKITASVTDGQITGYSGESGAGGTSW